MTKSAKIDIYLWPKRLKNHTLWGRTYLYSPYKGVPPRVMIGQGKLQILVINGVTSLGSGPHIPTRFFRKNSSGPCQFLFIFVFQPVLFYIIAAEGHYMLLPTLKTGEYWPLSNCRLSRNHYVKTRSSSILQIQGSHWSWKTWEVMVCVILISRPEKKVKVTESNGKDRCFLKIKKAKR